MRMITSAAATCAGCALTTVLCVLGGAAAVAATTYTWTGGGGANTNWSSALNWGGAAPADNENDVTLVFPALGGAYGSNNDRSGLRVVSLTVTTKLSAGDYLFTGNAIVLGGPVEMDSPDSGNPNLRWQMPAELSANVTVTTSGRQTRWEAPIQLGSHTLTLDAEGDIVLMGEVSGSGNLVKNNGSALTIRGANSYTGGTTGNGGAVYIDDAAAFGAGSTGTTFNGGALGFLPNGNVTIAEPFTFNGGRIIAYGTPTVSGPLTLGATLIVQAFEVPTVVTIAGAISGSGGVTTSGPGLVVLSAPNEAYSGATTVEAGTLRVNTDLASGNPLTVNSGATLQGNGSTAGAIAVQGGGRLAPGASPAELSSNGLSMVGGAVFAAELDGPAPGSEYDRLSVSGPVSLGGATLEVGLGYVPANGQEFTLIAQQAGQPVNGTFAALAEGATFQVGDTTFAITYQGGSGNDVVLVAAPTTTPTGQSPSATPTHTATTAPTTPPAGATPTQAQAPTATASSAPTPTATPLSAPCTGDCNGDGHVSISELVLGVNIALGLAPLSECPAFAPGGGPVTIADLVQAVGNALNGCD